MKKFVCAQCREEFMSSSAPGAPEAELERDFPSMSIDDCAIVCDDCYRLIKPVMAYDEFKKKLRKSLADDYRKMRRDGKGVFARLLWRSYRDTERKMVNLILHGDPGVPPGRLLN